MPQSELDMERVLTLWQKGMTAREIGQRVRHASGTAYTARGIEEVVRRARKAGDPRAARRRPGRKAMSPEERARRMRGRIVAYMRLEGHEITPEVEQDYLDGLCVIEWRKGQDPVVDYTRKWGEPDGAHQRNRQDTRAPT